MNMMECQRGGGSRLRLSPGGASIVSSAHHANSPHRRVQHADQHQDARNGADGDGEGSAPFVAAARVGRRVHVSSTSI
jgi:hypothetical protein